MTSLSLRSTLARAREEIHSPLLNPQTGSLDKITLEAGLEPVQERLRAMGVHQHTAFIESDDDANSGDRHS
jgi:hypothetical protein